MNTWYIERIITPDNAREPRVRIVKQFTMAEKASATDIATIGLYVLGWTPETAAGILSGADVELTDIDPDEEREFEFNVQGDDRTYTISLSLTPLVNPCLLYTSDAADDAPRV